MKISPELFFGYIFDSNRDGFFFSVVLVDFGKKKKIPAA
jgi:hypothetical protein